ncbi:MAG: hypothetical protein EXX96DRAFT_588823 [Benjaminiella poitrasii]|nr:MAG: hypothetical protein EXX96DRAFT_588823 [Benjaminiella poitrasii]
MDKLPLEILFHIFEYLPLSTYKVLYTLLPQATLDASLIQRLRHDPEAILYLVSTNLHELSSTQRYQNESHLPLYFASFDSVQRRIWTWPHFLDTDYYFRVKDAYVSHGKLILKRTTTSYPLISLWDIRKRFQTRKEEDELVTIERQGCVLDGCLLKKTSSNMTTTTTLRRSHDESNEDDARPSLPLHYVRKVVKTPSNKKSAITIPVYPDPTCGFLLVERVAIDLTTFLDLY